MKQTLIAAGFCWAALGVIAQTPTPQQVQQALEAIQSGELQVNPKAIEAAKEQYPAAKDVPNAEILKKAEEVQKKTPDEVAKEVEKATKEIADKEAADKKAADKKNDGTSTESGGESSLVSREGSGVGGGGRGANAPGFPAGLRRFGDDFFRNASVGDGLGTSSPSLPEYILSPGDELELYIWGRESRGQSVTIDQDGMFKYPPLEPFRVAGSRFDEAQKLISTEIQKIQGLTVSVRLGRLKSIRIMVLGEAARPGSYVMPAGVTVTGALFQSGGISSIGSMRSIEVRRGGRIAARFDVYDMLLKGSMRGNIQLLPGDALYIPIAPIQVAVTGNVKRPAIYEVKPGFKALDAIELAGGMDFDAFKGRVRLDRVQNNKRNIVLDVDLEKIDGRSNVRLEDGDVLHVDRVLDRIEDAVFLEGNVNRPGRYQYKKGMTVRDLVPSLKDLKPETFFEFGHIKRPAPDDGRPTLLNFSLADVLTKGARVPLEPRDVVVIYNRYDIAERPSVTVSGALRRPGEFTYKDGMTISDLVVLAGGLQDAYLPETHLRRIVYDAVRDSTYSQLIRINLKEVLENPLSDQNIEIRPFDAYTVFQRSVFMQTGAISVSGAVRRPGTFAAADQMRITDVIVMAGGLDEAHLAEAQLRRRVYDPVGDSIFYQLIRVKLRSAVENPQGEDNLALIPYDELHVISRNIFTGPKYVSVSGSVRKAGVFTLAEDMKIADLVLMANGLQDAHLAEAHLRRRVYSPERDSVYWKLIRVKLKSALEKPLGEDNLPLQADDQLVVFSRSLYAFSQSVSIFGAVQTGGTFGLGEQMRIPELVKMAGGLTKNSYKLEVELVRQNVINDSVVKREIRRLNMRDILDGKVTLDLQDGDGIYIREIIRSRSSMKVTLSGEFKFPGTYEFVEGERLSSVIRRAGGFTNEAYVRGLVFLRESVKQQQLRHASDVSRRLDGQLQGLLLQTAQETDRTSISMAIERNRYLLNEISSAPYLGRVVVKVDKKLKFTGSAWDIPLEGDDQIIVGPNVSTVSVLGEVYSPTTVIHTRGTNSVGEVLSRAGGVNLYGDYKATMYVDPDGSISTARTTPWYASFRGKSVAPGGTIVVPLKPPAKDYLEAWVKGTQVLYQLAIAVGVAKTLF